MKPPPHSQSELTAPPVGPMPVTPLAVHTAEALVRKWSNCREWQLIRAIAEIIVERDELRAKVRP
jgi:hypothetical protein